MRDWLSQRAKLSPEDVALIFKNEQWTYAQLNESVHAVAGILHEKGINAGAHVGILLQNRPIYVVIIHALARLRAVTVPLNLRLKSNELSWQISQAECVFILCSNESKDRLSDLELKNLEMILVDSMGWPTVINRASNLETQPFLFDLEAVQGIYFTSGTTGRPKGAMLTFKNHLWSAMGSAYRLGHHSDDRWLLVLPLYHIGGQAVVFRACQYGITIVLQERFDAEDLYQALKMHQVSIVSLVPTMLQRLILSFDDDGVPEKLRCILLGGATAPQSLVDHCLARNIPIALTYGLTEAASQVATASPAQVRLNPGTVGKPLFSCELHIVRQGNAECQPYEVGEIVVTGETIMQGYFHAQEATETALFQGGLHTGDLGYLDESGNLWVVSRRTDLIISGGENVYPIEVENVLLSHPAVREACVVGIDDPEWGQRVYALVVKDALEVSEQELIAYCRKHLAAYKRPYMVHFLDQIPRTASGKILRNAAKEQLESIVAI